MQYIEYARILTVYAIIFFIAYRIYQKQEIKGSWWKAIILLFVGIFSFSIEFSFFGQMHKFALIPLGVGLFYFWTSKQPTSREKYKSIVWLGFFANYAFFVTSIITVLIIKLLFPSDELTTYVQALDEAEIIITHRGTEDPLQLSDDAYELLKTSTLTEFEPDQWYFNQLDYTKEQFPYMLYDVTTPAGLPYDVFFFVEEDGQGLLVQTPEQHYYFRTLEPFAIKEGEPL